MIYDSETGDLTVALTGDSMLTRRLSVFDEKQYLGLVQILKDADVAFTNLESTVRGWDEGSPAISRMGRGTFMTTEPHLLDELKWMGIKLVSCANNHAFEFGEEGILATIRHLDDKGLAHAGTGRNLAEARAPGFLDTRHGRVALTAANASSIRSLVSAPWSKAGHQRPDHKGRAGVNPLEFQSTYRVDARAFEELARIEREFGLDPEKERDTRVGKENGSQEKALSFLATKFVRGEDFYISTNADEKDLQENLKWIREARRQADWVVASLHWHEFGSRGLRKARTVTEVEEPADFVIDFAHQAIDAGADLFVGHGSHFPLGVEIYKGKPIFYSLGNFIFENETVRSFPADAYERFDLDARSTPADWWDARTDGEKKGHPANPIYWENFVALCYFKDKNFSEARLYPIDQGHGRPRAQRGRPVLADGAVADKILDRLQRVSNRYRTKINKEGTVGVLRAT